MRRPLIGGKDFNISIGQGEQAQGGVKEAYPREGVRVFFFGKKEENECGREELVLMCEKMFFKINKKNYVCKQKTWKEVVCSK
jgi:hypothetical protein